MKLHCLTSTETSRGISVVIRVEMTSGWSLSQDHAVGIGKLLLLAVGKCPEPLLLRGKLVKPRRDAWTLYVVSPSFVAAVWSAVVGPPAHPPLVLVHNYVPEL